MVTCTLVRLRERRSSRFNWQRTPRGIPFPHLLCYYLLWFSFSFSQLLAMSSHSLPLSGALATRHLTFVIPPFLLVLAIVKFMMTFTLLIVYGDPMPLIMLQWAKSLKRGRESEIIITCLVCNIVRIPRYLREQWHPIAKPYRTTSVRNMYFNFLNKRVNLAIFLVFCYFISRTYLYQN